MFYPCRMSSKLLPLSFQIFISVWKSVWEYDIIHYSSNLLLLSVEFPHPIKNILPYKRSHPLTSTICLSQNSFAGLYNWIKILYFCITTKTEKHFKDNAYIIKTCFIHVMLRNDECPFTLNESMLYLIIEWLRIVRKHILSFNIR